MLQSQMQFLVSQRQLQLLVSHLSSLQVLISLRSHFLPNVPKRLLSENLGTMSSADLMGAGFLPLPSSMGSLSVADLKLACTASTAHYLQRHLLDFLRFS